MRKILLWGLMLGVIMVMPQFIDSAIATDQWKTYKLIKDGVLNESKWQFTDPKVDDESIVTMSIEDGRIKFEHRPDTEYRSAWLKLVKCPECVKGIQVEVTMGSSDDSEMYPLAGTIRGRIGNTVGKYGANEEYVWSQMAVRSRAPEDGGDRLFGVLDVMDAFDLDDWLYDPVYTQFYNPEEVDGNTYLITMILDREKNTVKYEVEGYGKVTYKIPEKIVPAYETFWGIGTRSDNSDGQGTVWFSDAVKVLVDLDCTPDTTAPTVKKTTQNIKKEWLV